MTDPSPKVQVPPPISVWAFPIVVAADAAGAKPSVTTPTIDPIRTSARSPRRVEVLFIPATSLPARRYGPRCSPMVRLTLTAVRDWFHFPSRAAYEYCAARSLRAGDRTPDKGGTSCAISESRSTT